MMQIPEPCFTPFQQAIDGIPLPEKFTFPFYYQPHPLCELASAQLQQHLSSQQLTSEHPWQHNFGLDGELTGAIGKMFGVLVVRNADGEIGYLAAYSGKLADSNHIAGFVPPVYDMLAEDSFFNEQNLIINGLNQQIEQLSQQPELARRAALLSQEQTAYDTAIAQHRQMMIDNRKHRKAQREQFLVEWEAKVTSQSMSDAERLLAQKQLEHRLSNESIKEKNQLRDLKLYWDRRIIVVTESLQQLTNQIDDLKQQRKLRSAELQQRLFAQYRFLNAKGHEKSLQAIFDATVEPTPPAGSGECAAPKLLHYAFKWGMTPLAMAEFWWGAAPKSEVRQHQQFYPACKRKCQPILSHMLEGLTLDDNPLLHNPAAGQALEIIYQDDVMAVVNKPAEFLSVPGIDITDSVYTRMQQLFPQATGPLIVHRLDMSTSGLMVIALTKAAHKLLQKQFIQRTAQKRYIALLDGELACDNTSGEISLPLRGDLDDRPRQLVCEQHGKAAITHWEIIERSALGTKVALYPKTGRTHQLRVHCAHHLGLGTPIKGDDLYGTKSERLHLHAQSLTLVHPISQQSIEFVAKAPF